MTEILNKLVKKYTSTIKPSSTPVQVKLPKLKKVGESKNEAPKIKLPKLKKVTNSEGVTA